MKTNLGKYQEVSKNSRRSDFRLKNPVIGPTENSISIDFLKESGLTSPGLYFLYRANQFVYVGKSDRPLMLRVMEHVYEDFDRFVLHLLKSSEECVILVKGFHIISARPEYNEQNAPRVDKLFEMVGQVRLRDVWKTPNDFVEEVKKYFHTHADGRPAGDAVGVIKRDFINGLASLRVPENRELKPFASRVPTSANRFIKSYRIDHTNQLCPTDTYHPFRDEGRSKGS